MSEHSSFDGLPAGEPVVGKTYRADGWMYLDPPGKMSHDMWRLFLETIGEGEYVILAQSSTADWIRGQLLVSPRGQENLKNVVDTSVKTGYK